MNHFEADAFEDRQEQIAARKQNSLAVSLFSNMVKVSSTYLYQNEGQTWPLMYLNSRHDSIKFTIEFEQDNEIPFLDILVSQKCVSL